MPCTGIRLSSYSPITRNWEQEKKSTQQQGTWKRLPNQDVLKNTHNTTSKGVSVLQTKRTHEQLSNPNGFPSKRRMVSFEINSSTRQRLTSSPTHHNESFSVELS